MGSKAKIFIDGSAGTTGLRIRERLAGRDELELIELPDELRKDPSARADALNGADVAFLCLPDAAAVESVSLVKNPDTVVIDTSTAHRTSPAFTYGFPEIGGLREKIRLSKRIANPGCHASGFVSLIAPLVASGVLSPDAKLSCFSLTGYSGGGKKMIADYEDSDDARKSALVAPRAYGLSQSHKHLPEMSAVCGLTRLPLFTPIVSSYYAGMEVTVPLFSEDVGGKTAEELLDVYRAYYAGSEKFIHVENSDEEGFLSAGAYAGRDDLGISVFGNADRLTLVSRFDNLGKGASGSAIQNMNIVLGLDESTGLVL